MSLLTLLAITVVAAPVALVGAGQAGWLSGTRPDDLGVRDGQLKPPRVEYTNSVSSQAERHPHTDYHSIDPIRIQGDAQVSFRRLGDVVAGMPGAQIIIRETDYLYAEFTTPTLRFVDDVEFALDATAGVIHMRSASRLGRKDFGVNRQRLEAVRSAMQP